MRVTGGIYGGRKIDCPPGVIRPAMDRMRESVFAILGDLSGLSFLDLFCGSGSIGIEAASRGAEPVHLVEKDRRKRTVIEKNLSIVTSEIKPFYYPVEAFIRRATTSYDIVFLDPPFIYKDKKKLITGAGDSGLLRQNGTLLIHYPSEENLPKEIGRLKELDLRRYGRSLVGFYGFT